MNDNATAQEPSNEDRIARAAALRRSLFGDAMVDQIMDSTDAYDRPFQQYSMRNVFGGAWLNGLLSMRELALVNVGMLAAAGRFEEASVYFGAALRVGVTVRELQDLLLHITAYCGTPVGRQMFRATKQVLIDRGVDLSKLEAQLVA